MRMLSVAVVAGLAFTVAGCSKSPYSSSLSGKVTYKGQPVKAGLVILIYGGDQAGQYETPLQDDGSYRFRDLPPGLVKVAVDNRAFDPNQKSPVYGADQKAAASGYGSSFSQYNKTSGGGAMSNREEGEALVGLSKEQKAELAKVFVKIPAKYATAKTTDLQYEVMKGDHTHDFELTD